MYSIKTTVVILSLSVSCIFSTLLESPARAGEFSDPCLGMPVASVAAATTLVAGTTHRSHGEELLDIEVERAGILSLDLLVPATAPGRGRLIVGSRANDWTLERSARHLVLAVPSAGRWRFRVTAEDPQQQLEIWRLRTGFVPATGIIEALVAGPDGQPMPARQLFFEAAGWTKTDEIVIDPDPFACHGDLCDPLLKTDEIVIDPDPLTCHGDACDPLLKTDEIVIDPDPLVGGGAGDPILAVLTVAVAGGVKTDEIVIDPDPFACHGDLCDPVFKTDEIVIDPDPFTCQGDLCDPLTKTDEIVIDPDPFAGCDPLKTDEIVIDPDPFAGWTVRGFRTPSVGSELAPLAEHWIADPSCRRGERDDHGDTPGCATRVASGQVLAAELGNGWGDDADVFAFTLRQARTVRLETRGGADTVGTLMDRHGHRLGVDDDGGADGGFRLVRALAPGQYFLRVEGAAGAEGAYQLTFAAGSF